MSHTQGPWRVSDTAIRCSARSRITLLEIVSPVGAIAHIYGSNIAEPDTMPNAHLIKGAPELLTSAIEAENWLDNHGGDPDEDDGLRGLLDMLRAAIANAKGQS